MGDGRLAWDVDGAMVVSGVDRRAERQRRGNEPAFDLFASKLRRPLMRPGTVRRSLLIERLARADPRPIVSVVAPPGYGKTTLLSQWAERNGQAFAWVSVDEADNDPKVLLGYVAEALDAVEPIDGRVFDALASPASSVPGTVAPRLGSAFASMTTPVALVLDDVHALRNPECRAAVSMLADHVPGGSRLALAGRDQPPLRVPRLRAEGKILEIGAGDLSLTLNETSALLRNADLALGEGEVAELHQRTEGWPAGLYLAALYLKEGGVLGRAGVSFGGDDRLVSEYLEAEFLARISRRQRVFLTRTAVLERMCGPLCDEVLERGESAEVLAGLARSNLLLVPLDRRGQWYRYHHLLRDTLLAGLERTEPGLIPVLQRRAAAWCLRNSLPEQALEYSIAAGDAETAAGLVQSLWLPTLWQSRIATVQRWFGWLEEHGKIRDHPMVAMGASVTSALTGRPAEAERWADVVDRWQEDAAQPDDLAGAWAVALQAILCRRGAAQMRADADEAAHRFTARGTMIPAIPLMQGLARVLAGDPDSDAYFEDAVSIGEQGAVLEVRAIARCQRALLAMARGRWDWAEAFAAQAREVMRTGGVEESFATPLVCAVRARLALHRGDVPAARQELVSAQRIRPLLTYALPHLAVQARIELAHAHLTLADLAGARTLAREIDDLLNRRPGLGTLVDEAAALRNQLSKQDGSIVPGASSLTAAELRVLPLLSTYLPLPEIGEQLFLSRHTIKSHAKSIYRKLGASTRSEAVKRAREVGLLDG
jgi:LuxR family transcriptional regulator, maltose regulon positive regulatory protein